MVPFSYTLLLTGILLPTVMVGNWFRPAESYHDGGNEAHCLLVRGGGQRGPTEEEREKIRLRIGITKEQQTQIEQLYVETDQQRREIGRRMHMLYRQLFTLYDNYDFDRNQARAIRRELTDLHRRTLWLHAENEEKLRKILTKEQFDKLRALMREKRDEWRREREKGRMKSST
ncbi:MAG TPA: Spy/CpxP family protein refolding chaperone [Chthonomonadales bacterium]|nr:Spy/CpxP family protein refolding chaperone [Chthonomonadales bacterium]